MVATALHPHCKQGKTAPLCTKISTLKEFIRREVKPKTKDELVDGILRFWETVDFVKCKKYIKHLDKVISKVIELFISCLLKIGYSKFNQVQGLLDPLRVRRPRGFATRPHSGQTRRGSSS